MPLNILLSAFIILMALVAAANVYTVATCNGTAMTPFMNTICVPHAR